MMEAKKIIKKYIKDSPNDVNLIKDYLEMKKELLPVESYMFNISHEINPKYSLINSPL